MSASGTAIASVPCLTHQLDASPSLKLTLVLELIREGFQLWIQLPQSNIRRSPLTVEPPKHPQLLHHGHHQSDRYDRTILET